MLFSAAPYSGECEDPYPSLSDYHDYEPNLEFDDSDLHQKHPEGPDGKCRLFPYSVWFNSHYEWKNEMNAISSSTVPSKDSDKFGGDASRVSTWRVKDHIHFFVVLHREWFVGMGFLAHPALALLLPPFLVHFVSLFTPPPSVAVCCRAPLNQRNYLKWGLLEVQFHD